VETDDIGSLKFLKWLVTTLMVVMIIGFIVLIVFLVTRFPSAPDTSTSVMTLPDKITLPDDAIPQAFTATSDWYAIVTEAGQVLVYDRASGALLKTIAITSGN